MNWDYVDVELQPHPEAPDLVHLQLCIPSATAEKIIAAMGVFPMSEDLAMAAIISALRPTSKIPLQ
jgi:hypothetical protein